MEAFEQYVSNTINKHQTEKSALPCEKCAHLYKCINKSSQANMTMPKRGSRKFCQRGSNFDNIFLFSLMSGGRIQMPLLAGHQRPASETPFKWRFAGVTMMAQH